MTSISPERVTHVTSVLFDGAELDVMGIIPSMDTDRNAFVQAIITVRSVTPAQWTALDPRKTATPTVSIHMRQYDPSGNMIGELPKPPIGASPYGVLRVRTIRRDRKTGHVTITAASGETMMEDKKRISPNTLDITTATTVAALVNYALTDVGLTGLAYSYDTIVGSTSIPSGDRRLMMQGESFIDLILPELQAIDCRLYDYWGRMAYAGNRNTPPTYIGAPTTHKLATYTQAEGAPADADPIVWEADETVTREGDWADGVLIEYHYEHPIAGAITAYHASGSGVNTKGRKLTWDRARPADNAADKVVTRTKIRGAEFTITARARLDVIPGQSLTVYFRDGTSITGNIRSVEWNLTPGDGSMTVRAESGNPV